MLSSFFFFCGDNRNEPYIFCLCIACRQMCACVLGLGTLPSSSTPGYGQSSLWCNSPAWWLHPWGSGSAGCSSLAWWAQCWITALSVYVLDTCSCPIEKEFYQDCKIKHMSEKCQDIDFPTCLCICIMNQPLITQLHTVSSTEFLLPSVHRMSTAVQIRSHSIFFFIIVSHDRQ